MRQMIGNSTGTVYLGSMGIKRIYQGTNLIYERSGSALFIKLI